MLEDNYSLFSDPVTKRTTSPHVTLRYCDAVIRVLCRRRFRITEEEQAAGAQLIPGVACPSSSAVAAVAAVVSPKTRFASSVRVRPSPELSPLRRQEEETVLLLSSSPPGFCSSFASILPGIYSRVFRIEDVRACRATMRDPPRLRPPTSRVAATATAARTWSTPSGSSSSWPPSASAPSSSATRSP